MDNFLSVAGLPAYFLIAAIILLLASKGRWGAEKPRTIRLFRLWGRLILIVTTLTIPVQIIFYFLCGEGGVFSVLLYGIEKCAVSSIPSHFSLIIDILLNFAALFVLLSDFLFFGMASLVIAVFLFTRLGSNIAAFHKDAETVLRTFGGEAASLQEIDLEVKRLTRARRGRLLSTEKVRGLLKKQSSDSDDYAGGADLYTMPSGKDADIFGLRPDQDKYQA